MPRISVIVPAFDVHAYVGPLLDDLARQTYRDFEVLVVDDGSTDGTRTIIEECTERDQRFRMLTTGRSGAGSSTARNVGLAATTGDELAFVDADDRLTPDFLEMLHRSLDENNSDVASCNVRRLKGFETKPSSPHFRVFDRERLRTHVRRTPELVYDMTIWNKLSRRRLWHAADIQFDDGRWINDTYPSLRLHAAARQVDVLAEVLYYWWLRTDVSTLITTRKYVDADARLKSLHDRFHALEKTRQMLVEELNEPAVVEQFDERVLLHDLRVYLSFHAGGDGRYREALSKTVLAYLTAHDVNPERYQLGLFLHETYRAILADDRERLADILDPATRLSARRVRRKIHARLETSGRPRRSRRLRFPTGGDTGTVDITDRLEARVRLTDVHLDPTDGTFGVAGEAQIRDGRDNLAGDWSIRLVLASRRGGEVPSDPARLGHIEEDAHPMLRAGWRAFVSNLVLPAPGGLSDLPSWRLGGYVRLDGVEIAIEPYLTAAARRALGGGASLSPMLDALPVANRDHQLVLRAEPARVRVTGAYPGGHDQIVVGLARSGETVDRLSLRTPAGETITAASLAAGDSLEVVLQAPELPHDVERLELWAHGSGREERVRADPAMTAVWLAAPPATEGLVLRQTTRGRVVLDRAVAHAEVDQLEASARQLVLGGPVLGPYPATAGTKLEARCRWTNARVAAELSPSDGAWTASLPVESLTVGAIDGGRTWALHLVDPVLGVSRLGVPTAGRHRYPLSVYAGSHRFELRVSGGGAATLWARRA